MAKPVKDLVASVHQRLLDLDRERVEDFSLRLTRYAMERLLYRLSQSPHGGGFVLKGALLFAVWGGASWRPTRDVDLLGPPGLTGDGLRGVFSDLCRLEVEPDGLEFDGATIEVSAIREDREQAGQRVVMLAFMGKTRIRVQVDVGVGDAVWPEPEVVVFPTLLAFPAPSVRAYHPATVVAEKLEAMVTLDMANSRMKDFWDLCAISARFAFTGTDLVRAVRGTFRRRGVVLPEGLPTALTTEFGRNPSKQLQWKAFLQRTPGLEAPADFAEVVQDLRRFLGPVVAAVQQGRSLEARWSPGHGWQTAEE